MKNIFVRFLKLYRPFDRKFRDNPVYARLSEALYYRFRKQINKSAARVTLAQLSYTRQYGELSVDPQIIVFESYWGRKIADHPLALFRALATDPAFATYKVHWTLHKDQTPPKELERYSQITYVAPESAEYGRLLLQAKYLVNNVTFPPFFIRQPDQVYCNTWHGVPMKAMGRDMNAPLISMANTQRNYLQANVLPVSSAYYTQAAIKPYYVDALIQENLVEIGSARVDDILTPKIPDADLRARFGIKATQKVVLMGLTWRGSSTAIKDSFDEQLALFQSVTQHLGPEYFVLFSAHQMMKLKPSHVPEGGALLSDQDNINDVLTIVDVLISDYSSIIFDFLPLNRPIILFVPDLEEYRSERGLYIEPSDLPCTAVVTTTSLVKAVRDSKKPSDFADFATYKNRFIPYEDGQAASQLMQKMVRAGDVARDTPPRRQRLLFAPGGMMPNGITASLKNLIANLDYTRFDPYVVIDAQVMDKDISRQEQFFGFDPRCNWILRCGEMLRKPSEADVYKGFRDGKVHFSDHELTQIKEMFERESARVLGDVTFDVAIEFGGYSPYWTGVILGAKAKQHVIYQHNHLWAEATNPNPKRNQKQLYSIFHSYRWFDQIVAVSDETRAVNEKHLKDFYRDEATPKTVRNTINPSAIQANAAVPLVFSNQMAAAILQEPDVISFVALGRLSPEKRYDRMIAAFAKVVKVHPKAVLFICGKGPLEQDLSKLIQRHGVTSNIFLMGHVSNPHALLKACNACVMSSDYEGQPMALLEAQCLNVHCIGTDIPGIRSVLKDGRGTIVAPNDTALAQAMCDLAEGTLAKPQFANVSTYVDQTMAEFYDVICDTSQGRH